MPKLESPSKISNQTPIVSRSGSGKLIIASPTYFDKNDDMVEYNEPKSTLLEVKDSEDENQ